MCLTPAQLCRVVVMDKSAVLRISSFWNTAETCIRNLFPAETCIQNLFPFKSVTRKINIFSAAKSLWYSDMFFSQNPGRKKKNNMLLICQEHIKLVIEKIYFHQPWGFLCQIIFSTFSYLFQSLDSDKPVAPVKRSPLHQETNLANFSYRFSMYNLNGSLTYLPSNVLF